MLSCRKQTSLFPPASSNRQAFASTALIRGFANSLGREILGWVGRTRCHEAMQCLRPDVRVAAQHLPILVPGHQCNLFDGQADLEQAAGAFVAQVMEVEVLDVSICASAAERRADGF